MDDESYAADTDTKDKNLTDEHVKKKRGRKPKYNGVVVPKEKKKRGRKPKVQQLATEEPKRTRKRGRKPKIPMKTISELRRKYNNVGTNIEFENTEISSGNDDVQELDKEQKYVSFGNLNILITEEEKVDTSDIKKILFEQSRNHAPLIDKSNDSDFNSPVNSESETEILNFRICKECKKKISDETETKKTEIIVTEKKKTYKQLCGFSKELEESKAWPSSSKSFMLVVLS